MNEMNVAEAAQALGITEQSVRHRLARGIMQGRRVGKKMWLIPGEEVERMKEQGRLKPGPAKRLPTPHQQA